MSDTRTGNSLDQARIVNLRGGRKTFQDRVSGADPNDYYRFRLDSRSSLDTTLSNSQNQAKVEVLDHKGQRVAQFRGRADNRNRSQNFELNEGVYFIRVSRLQGNTKYTLQLQASSAQAVAHPNPIQQFARQVINFTNAFRRQEGLAPLKSNAQLAVAARRHSRNMAENDFFSHESPNGFRPADRIQQAGYQYSAIGENIAAGQITPREVVDSWMRSPGHRANILNPNLQEIGIGYYFKSNDTGNVNYNHYWTQNFGRPLD